MQFIDLSAGAGQYAEIGGHRKGTYEDPDFALAKGNAQVRDGDSSNPEQSGSMMSFKEALGLAKLRWPRRRTAGSESAPRERGASL